jgi:oxepin-CoA hydrolase/3-oxo-5,6-dehydrosuberyl-CoA semialdehyde dehydrogenase
MKQPEAIEHFLSNELVLLLKRLDPNQPPIWGTMNVWQMIEHLALPFKASNGQIEMPVTTPVDKLERVKQIGLMNDRPLQRNFNNPLFTDDYKKRRNPDLNESLNELQRDIDLFMASFKAMPTEFKRVHNIFGPLDYQEWLQFHYKHVKHHLEQFSVSID